MNARCGVCGCDLPTMPNGKVSRMARRTHNAGRKHQKAEMEQSEERQKAKFEKWEARMRILSWRPHPNKSEQLHRLLLGIVATRLRTQYSSIEDARLIWLLESQCLLNKLDDNSMQSALLEPAMKILAATHIRQIANDSYMLVKLIADYM